MRMTLLFPAALAIGLLGTLAGHAAAVPCEDALRDLRAAIASTTLDTATAQQVDELLAKGVSRCTADDDERADAFFAQAMQMVQP